MNDESEETYVNEESQENAFKQYMRDIINKSQLDRFFPEDDPFLHALINRAIALERVPGNMLNAKDLAHLALYRLVFYCGMHITLPKALEQHLTPRQFIRRQLLPGGGRSPREPDTAGTAHNQYCHTRTSRQRGHRATIYQQSDDSRDVNALPGANQHHHNSNCTRLE